MRYLSIKAKMALTMAIVFVLLVIGETYFAFRYFEEAYTKSVSHDLMLMTATMADNIDNYLGIAQGALEAAAAALPAETAADPSLARKFLKARVSLQSIFPDGIFLISPSGFLVAEYPPGVENGKRSFTKDDFFTSVITQKTPNITLLPKWAGKASESVVAIPITRPDGKVRAVLAGAVDLGARMRSAEKKLRERIGEGGHISLSSQDGVFLLHNGENAHGQQIPSGILSLFNSALRGEAATGETIDCCGARVLASLQKLERFDGVVIVSYPLCLAYAPLETAKSFFLAAILVGTALLFLIAWFLTQRIIEPLRTMTRHIEALPQLPPENRLLKLGRWDEIGILANTFDQMIITLESRQASLLASERHLAEAQKVAHVGSWEFDLASQKITWSQELFSLVRRDPARGGPDFEEVVQMFHPEDRSLLLDSVQAAIAEGKSYRFDYRVPLSDGSLKHLAATGEPIFDDNGKIVSLFGTVLDITGRKMAEEKLRNSEARFRSIFETARDAVFLADLASETIIDANGQAEKLLGRPRGEIIGMHHSQLAPPEEEQYSREMFALHIRTNGAEPIITNVLNAEGTSVPVEINASIFELAPGEKCMMGIFRNISERRKEEEHILTLNQDLQRQAAELAAINRDLESFSYSLSHDLKTPLTCISIAAESLREAVFDEAAGEAEFLLATILAESQRMEDLLDAMLLLSRVSRAEIRHEEIDLAAMVQEMLLKLKAEHPERTVEWEVAPKAIVSGDARLMMSMLENLIGNAWKYTGKLEVARIEFGSAGEEKIFFVRDNGAGFDMAKAERLFQPFQRLHASTDFKGSGIGLTTVQRIVERHGGRIWAEAEPDKGATFYFTLQP